MEKKRKGRRSKQLVPKLGREEGHKRHDAPRKKFGATKRKGYASPLPRQGRPSNAKPKGSRRRGRNSSNTSALKGENRHFDLDVGRVFGKRKEITPTKT